MGNDLLYSKIIRNGLSNFACYSNREIGDMKDRVLSWRTSLVEHIPVMCTSN